MNTDIVIGIDEVGRGPLAGPVVVGAVVFNKNHSPIAEINDSKKIPKKYLKNISDNIKTECRVWSVGCGCVEMINNKGIIFALQYSISEAVANVIYQLSPVKIKTPTLNISHSNIQIIIDGLPYQDVTQFSRQCQHLHRNQCIEYRPKADGTIYSVAAASIIAKVYRDELMTEFAQNHSQYGWEENAGYGTKKHRNAIQQFGLTEHHRELFCRKLNTTF